MTTSISYSISTTIRAAAVAATLFLLHCAALAAESPNSATLRVIVGRENNTLISGASVCVAPASGAVRSAFSDITGQVTFDGLEPGQVTITVSAAGFIGQSHASTLPASGGTARFILAAGAGGPVCNATPPPPSRIPPKLTVTSFDWHVNRRTPLFFEIALSVGATTTPGGPVIPTDYRVGESADLSNTPFTAYHGGVITFQMGYNGNSLTAYGQRTLFIQIKQNDLTSAVASKSVNLQPVQTSEFRFDASTLPELLDLVRTNGFRLGVTAVSTTQNHCPTAALEGLSIAIPNGYLRNSAWEKIVEVTLVELGQKRFTAGWRVKSIDIGDSPELASDTARTIAGQADGDGFRVVIHLSAGPKNSGVSDADLCFQNRFPLRGIVLEGPADDMTLDQAKRWKNMFPSH